MFRFGLYFILIVSISTSASPWIADEGNGSYKNPVLHADYPDPDVVRVGDDFYMVASSLHQMPGIPVLHSKDLVNWTLISHVFQRLPFDQFRRPAHGKGAWAPSINFHNGVFYVYFCTPEQGLFVATATDSSGPWALEQVVDVALWEDPAPFWDDDGTAYLVRGKVGAGSLFLHRMSTDGKQLLDSGHLIYSEPGKQPMIEGPKLIKKDGWHYIFASAGGAQSGWQTVLRSRRIYGPYESKIVMHQGNTSINSAYQGGVVQLSSGQWWFLHTQDRGVYGRVVHLQPVSWQDDWPVIGVDADGDGVGEPVAHWPKPDVGKRWPPQAPEASDEFNGAQLGLQWQWQGNSSDAWYSFNRVKGRLRLYAVANPTQHGNLHFVPNLLLQKFVAPRFTATAKVSFSPKTLKDKTGLVIMGKHWGYIALYRTKVGARLGVFEGEYNESMDVTVEQESVRAQFSDDDTYSYYLRVSVAEGGGYQFSFSEQGKQYQALGKPLQASPGARVGARVGLFSLNPGLRSSSGFAEYDWFRVE